MSTAIVTTLLCRPAIASPAGRRTPSIVLPFQDVEYVSHIAIDIGGSLIKLVYFSTGQQEPADGAAASPAASGGSGSSGSDAGSNPGAGNGADGGNGAAGRVGSVSSINAGSGASGNGSRGGRLHFVKFETSRLTDALDFIEAKVTPVVVVELRASVSSNAIVDDQPLDSCNARITTDTFVESIITSRAS